MLIRRKLIRRRQKNIALMMVNILMTGEDIEGFHSVLKVRCSLNFRPRWQAIIVPVMSETHRLNYCR